MMGRHVLTSKFLAWICANRFPIRVSGWARWILYMKCYLMIIWCERTVSSIVSNLTLELTASLPYLDAERLD